jgi:two-component system response regulator YesN
MEYAKELLMHKRYRVKEVAVMVGIEDPFYFNKLFKSFYGCPPSKYENSSIKM